MGDEDPPGECDHGHGLHRLLRHGSASALRLQNKIQQSIHHLRGVARCETIAHLLSMEWTLKEGETEAIYPNLDPRPPRHTDLLSWKTRLTRSPYAVRVWRTATGVLVYGPRYSWPVFHSMLKLILTIAVVMLTPGVRDSGRSTPCTEEFLCALMTMNSVFYLVRFPDSPRARAIRALLPAAERRSLQKTVSGKARSRPEGWRKAIRSLIDRQAHGVLGTKAPAGGQISTNDMGGNLYIFSGQSFVYLGKAQGRRTGILLVTGLVVRWIREHLRLLWCFALRGRSLVESRRIRYRLGRRDPPGTIGFLCARRGPERTIEIMETCAINALDTNSNEKKRSSHRGPRKPRTRRGKGCAAAKKAPFEDIAKTRGKFEGLLDSKTTLDRIEKKGREHQVPDLLQEPLTKNDKVENGKWDLNFSTAYQKAQAWRCENQQEIGPINTYSKRFRRLFLLYICRPKVQVDWKLLKFHWNKKDPLETLLNGVQNLKKVGRKRAAMRVLNSELKKRGLPTKKTLTVPVAEKSHGSTLRKILICSLAAVKNLSGFPSRWILKNTKFSVRRLIPFGLERKPAQCIKQAVVSKLDDYSKNRVERSLSGKDFLRIPGATNFAKKTELEDLQRLYSKGSSAWAWKAHLSSMLSNRICREAGRSEYTLVREKEEEACAREAFCSQFLVSCDAEHNKYVYVPEDKSPSETWRLPAYQYQYLLLKDLRDSEWELAEGVTTEVAEEAIREHLRRNFPPRWAWLKKRLPDWKRPCLPYVYGTLKGKCWCSATDTSEGKKVCEKIGHKCLRKIVSNCSVYAKKIGRKVHRALQVLVSSTPCWETWNTRDVRRDILRNVARLDRPVDCCVCIGCGCEKDPFEFMVADAGAFYEQIAPSRAYTDLKWIQDYVYARTGHASVSVKEGRKAEGHLGGNPAPYIGFGNVTMVFLFHELLAFLVCFLGISFVQFGDSVFSVKNTPIGNVLGRMAVAIVTAKCEIVADAVWHITAKTFNINTNLPRNKVLFCMKYVDDLMTGSWFLCGKKCQYRFAQETYPCSFELQHAGRSVEWLDLSIHASKNGFISILPKLKNYAFLTGESQVRERNTVAPWWSPLSETQTAGIFTGHLTRWHQITRDSNVIERLAWLRTTEFIHAGYSISYLRAVWARVPHPQLRKRICTALSKVKAQGLGKPGQTSELVAKARLEKERTYKAVCGRPARVLLNLPPSTSPDVMGYGQGGKGQRQWKPWGGNGGHPWQPKAQRVQVEVIAGKDDKKKHDPKKAKKNKKKHRSRSSSSSSNSSRSSSSSSRSRSKKDKKDKKKKSKKHRKDRKKSRSRSRDRKDRKKSRSRSSSRRRSKDKTLDEDRIKSIVSDTAKSLADSLQQRIVPTPQTDNGNQIIIHGGENDKITDQQRACLKAVMHGKVNIANTLTTWAEASLVMEPLTKQILVETTKAFGHDPTENDIKRMSKKDFLKQCIEGVKKLAGGDGAKPPGS